MLQLRLSYRWLYYLLGATYIGGLTVLPNHSVSGEWYNKIGLLTTSTHPLMVDHCTAVPLRPLKPAMQQVLPTYSNSTSVAFWLDSVPPHTLEILHDDVVKWKNFPLCHPFVRRIHWPPLDSPHKGHWRGALMFLWSVPEQTVEKTIESRVLSRYLARFDVTFLTNLIFWFSGYVHGFKRFVLCT